MLSYGTQRRDNYRALFICVLLDEVGPNPTRGAEDEEDLVPL